MQALDPRNRRIASGTVVTRTKSTFSDVSDVSVKIRRSLKVYHLRNQVSDLTTFISIFDEMV